MTQYYIITGHIIVRVCHWCLVLLIIVTHVFFCDFNYLVQQI